MKISIRAPANGPAWLPDLIASFVFWLNQLAKPRVYTVATLPAAAENTGLQVYVSNETGGATLAFSDGTNWRRVQDRAVVS